jgi:hypothetical protein
MTERALLISGSREWGEAMQNLLKLEGHEADNGDGSELAERLQSFSPTMAILNADQPAAGVPVGGRLAVIQRDIETLLSRAANLPIVLVASVPSSRLDALADRFASAKVILFRDFNLASLVKQILSAAAAPAQSQPSAPADWATIEITIYATDVTCVARAGAGTPYFDRWPWGARRSIELMNQRFQFHETGQAEFGTYVNLDQLAETSQRLRWDLFETPLNQAISFCQKNMKDGGPIYVRFVLHDGDLEFVPLELVATANQNEYLRSVRPLARKLIVPECHINPDRALRACRPDCRVLYIGSNVTGTLSVPGQTFKRQSSLFLRSLPKLKDELAMIRTLYPNGHLRELALVERQDNIKALRDAFRDGPFDVVHFAGHTVRADGTNQVYLALPGAKPMSILPYDAGEFAGLAAGADVRLVILSSCEGTSGLTLSRMASYGVPAVAGFRWPVDDSDAALFTPFLHEALRGSGQPVPIIEAFHEALARLGGPASGRLVWFSPVLVVQRTEWHEFAL